MRILLALLVVIVLLTGNAMIGCNTPDSKIEGVQTMVVDVDTLLENSLTEGYKTATFALG